MIQMLLASKHERDGVSVAVRRGMPRAMTRVSPERA